MELHKGKFAIPTIRHIGSAAVRLYRLEAKRTKWIEDAAKEHGKILGHEPSQYWTHSMPEQLASVLESFEKGAAEAAAIGFLRSRGFRVDVVQPNGNELPGQCQ